MKKVSTAFQVPDYSKTMPEVAKGATPAKQPTRDAHPDFTLRGSAAQAIIDSGVKAGDTFTGEATFKVVEMKVRKGSSSQYGGDYMDGQSSGDSDDAKCSVELEIHGLSVENPPGGGAGDGEQSAEDAVDAFREGQGGAAAATDEAD